MQSAKIILRYTALSLDTRWFIPVNFGRVKNLASVINKMLVDMTLLCPSACQRHLFSKIRFRGSKTFNLLF